jgi:predicted SAM-dependent methyltransferase
MTAPLKIEFGANGRHLDGWLCTDIDDCDISVYPLRFQSDSVDMAMASHVIEHITTHECFHFFQEVYRILKPGGVFRVIVPTLEKISTRKHAVELILGHGHKQLFSQESLKEMLWAAGFDNINTVEKDPILDVHDKEIGVELDLIESVRIEARK